MYKNAETWAPQLLKNSLKGLWRNRNANGLKHVLFCVADHFEPKWMKAGKALEMERVRRWRERYPNLAFEHRDSNGRPPQHTWFYAVEEYEPDSVEAISGLCGKGYGELELHLHHDGDTPEGFRSKLEQAKRDFSSHGAFIVRGSQNRHAFGFIHGNWALNNSCGGKWCGVDNELKILSEAGCYADFTFPSAPDESQTLRINSIYYAQDRPGRRKSHDDGVAVAAGKPGQGDLILIQGPLALNWKQRKHRLFPRIENASIHGVYPPTPDRVQLWVEQGIHVEGRPEWIFVKVHCHGAQEESENVLLGEGAEQMYRILESRYNDGSRYRLHYVTAREMFNIVKAAEDGLDGDPSSHRDYLIPPYLNSGPK